MALEVFSDLSERLNYNIPEFPLYARNGELRTFERHAAACHWHYDLEFIVVLDGAMDYFVNGQTLHMSANEGIFVNSKRLHYGYSKDNANCSFLVIAVHPALLGEHTHAGKVFLESKFGFHTDDCVLLTVQTDWQKELIESIGRLYDEMHNGENNTLRLLSMVTSLCTRMADHLKPFSTNQVDENSWMAVWKMTGFVHQNYTNKITLDDIRAAGSVCRSKCCQLFHEYVGQTPNTYLARYRINKSCEMLKDTNMSVIEVSMACGFQSPSYFTQVFQKEMGLTPKNFRMKYSVRNTKAEDMT